MSLRSLDDINKVFLDSIPLSENLEGINVRLPYDSGGLRHEVLKLLPEASKIAKPRGAYLLFTPSVIDDSRVAIGGVIFTSELLVKNIGRLDKVFMFLATEGIELSNWADSLPPEKNRAAFAIRFLALKNVEERLEAIINDNFDISYLSAMAPGALREWPISEQIPFFKLMGSQATRLSMVLDPQSFWLSPALSSTGVFFDSPEGFSSCRLCIAECPWRHYPYGSQIEGI
ncbi:MAG: hypothetical protein LBE38_11325 [Deltaproteobacteria bacterium]|jgi:hypothetical protein|nr:hypothetical protein [Deltaproteobacteria bacterium]